MTSFIRFRDFAAQWLPRPRSLRWKISSLFVFLFSVGIALSFIGLYSVGRLVYAFALQQTHADVASLLAHRLQPLLDRQAAYADLRQVGSDFAEIDPDSALYILDEKGTILTSVSPHTERRSSSVPIAPVEEYLRRTLDFFPILNLDPSHGDQRGFSAAPLSIGGTRADLYVVLEGSDLFDKALGVARENVYITWGVVMTIGASVGTMFLGLFALVLIARRFESIVALVKEYRGGTFSARLTIRGDDELDELAGAINGMASTIETNISELEHRDELRRDLIADVSHDLRAPATHIRIAVEELVARDGRGGTEELLPQIRSLQASTDVLEQMLRELFDLAALEAKQTEPHRTRFSMTELFDELELRFRHEAESKGLALSFAADDSQPEVLADAGMIGRALGNLIGNAIRYTPQGGSVNVIAERTLEAVAVKVCDSGVGISNEELQHLFRRYYRGSASRPNISGSTGLGLAITKRIIEIHDGTIFVESEVDKGTTFWFELPVALSGANARVNGSR